MANKDNSITKDPISTSPNNPSTALPATTTPTTSVTATPTTPAQLSPSARTPPTTTVETNGTNTRSRSRAPQAPLHLMPARVIQAQTTTLRSLRTARGWGISTSRSSLSRLLRRPHQSKARSQRRAPVEQLLGRRPSLSSRLLLSGLSMRCVRTSRRLEAVSMVTGACSHMEITSWLIEFLPPLPHLRHLLLLKLKRKITKRKKNPIPKLCLKKTKLKLFRMKQQMTQPKSLLMQTKLLKTRALQPKRIKKYPSKSTVMKTLV